MAVLQVKNLTKKFGSFTAVNNISFELKEGEILGLLGPNGAGKTTVIQMLLGITTPDSGNIYYFNKDFFEHSQFCLSRLNFTSAFNNLQGRTTVWENLVVFANLYQVENYIVKIKKLRWRKKKQGKALLRQGFGRANEPIIPSIMWQLRNQKS